MVPDWYLSGPMSNRGADDIFDKTELSNDLPLPLYLQLARHLRSLVTEGKLGQGDALPGERELAERLGVSRITVRKAVRELSAEGLLQQRQGAGTFVNRGPHVEQRLRTLTSFSEDVASRGLKPGSVWLHRKVAVATPEETLALCLSPGSTVSRLHRLRTANGTPMALEMAVVPTRFLPDPEEVKDSLYDTLRRRGFTPFRALQRLTAIRLTPELAKQLDVPEGAAAFSIERRTMLEDDTLLELVHSHYRGDAYDFVVELSLSSTGRGHETIR